MFFIIIFGSQKAYFGALSGPADVHTLDGKC